MQLAMHVVRRHRALPKLHAEGVSSQSDVSTRFWLQTVYVPPARMVAPEAKRKPFSKASLAQPFWQYAIE